ncbi:S41 family peptidase [Intestinimonas sp.]|uniref:S41 family peptidase n=1 Tax=Intestinimonas sp. TaxID=1965293 RepID=UPI00261DCEF9|nr:S41 family peptidase [Intestinimonas sp.]
MKEKRFSLLSLLVTAVLAVLLTVGALAGGAWALLGPEGLGMVETVALVNTLFVGEHDLGTASDQAMDALIEGLGDRWSYYMDAEGYAAQQESRSNSYVGIGVTVTYPEEGGLLIQSMAEGGPAEEAGLRAGERIVAVDGTALTAENRQEGASLIKGEEGTAVTLTLESPDGSRREVTVTRKRVEEPPARGELLSDGTGLVTIKNFNSRCAQETMAAVEELVVQGAERLVFDVRNNGGGYVDELTALLDDLLPEGDIFRSETKAGTKRVVTSDADCVDLPMAVLVNGGTYSAAELFAAQLQEMDRGIIVGEPTFGKGFSQQTFPLMSGGAVNLSTARYYTGGGVCLIGAGLTLDREVTLTEEQNAALSAGVLAPEDDPQLQAAVDLLKG